LGWTGIGLLVLLGATVCNFEWMYRRTFWLSGIAALPLLLVWVTGASINGMRGWYDFGGFFFQPSELAKPLFLLLLCRLANEARSTWSCVIRLSVGYAVFAVPLVLQPDFGTLLVYTAGVVMVYWLYIGRKRWLFAGLAAAVPAVMLIVHNKNYVWRRFEGFWSPGSDPLGAGWHVLQLRYAMASGGLTGQGIENTFWSNAYLPYSYCDSAFATMVEAVGAMGGIITLGLYLGIVLAAVKAAERDFRPVRSVFVVAGAGLIVIQALIHISVNVTLMPVTGLTCPLLSYGGSSLTGTLLLLGMMLAALRKNGVPMIPENIGNGGGEPSRMDQ